MKLLAIESCDNIVAGTVYDFVRETEHEYEVFDGEHNIANVKKELFVFADSNGNDLRKNIRPKDRLLRYLERVVEGDVYEAEKLYEELKSNPTTPNMFDFEYYGCVALPLINRDGNITYDTHLAIYGVSVSRVCILIPATMGCVEAWSYPMMLAYNILKLGKLSNEKEILAQKILELVPEEVDTYEGDAVTKALKLAYDRLSLTNN